MIVFGKVMFLFVVVMYFIIIEIVDFDCLGFSNIV